MAKIYRKYFLGQHYEIDETNQQLILKPEFLQKLQTKTLSNNRGFKKVGGSSVGDVLVTDRYKSQFAAFCNIANLGLPVLDEKYVNAGREIEPLVIKAIEKTTQKKIKVFPALKYNYDYFADKDPIIGGVPDGYIASENLILEIKTTGEKNYEQWIQNGVPLSYKKQAAQYAFLMGAKNYAIIAAFLKEEDYADPKHFPVNQRKIKSWKFNVDQAIVADDIARIKNLYLNWTNSGVSPQYDPVRDVDLLTWLKCRNEAEWEVLKAQWIADGKYVV